MKWMVILAGVMGIQGVMSQGKAVLTSKPKILNTLQLSYNYNDFVNSKILGNSKQFINAIYVACRCF